jgi:hypothetical protein
LFFFTDLPCGHDYPENNVGVTFGVKKKEIVLGRNDFRGVS